MSDASQSTEDAVASALANGLHAVGVDTLVLLSLKNGEVTSRMYGDHKQAVLMSVRHAAKMLTDAANVIEETEVAK